MNPAEASELGLVMERNVSEVFGEPDPVRRLRVMAELYTENCAFYDVEGQSFGQPSISERVTRILDKSRSDFAFVMVGRAEVVHDLGRLRWQTGPAGAPAVVSGMDIALFANGRIRTLYTFIELDSVAEA